MKQAMWTILGICAVTAGCASAEQRPSQVAGVASSGCSQLSASAAQESAFYKPGQVYEAKAIKRRQVLARAHQPERTVGAELYMHAQPGMTKEYLQRSLECHTASGRPAHASDPLHPQSGSVREVAVRSVGSSFAISVVGDSPETGKEIWQRARSFAGADVTVEQLASVQSPTVN